MSLTGNLEDLPLLDILQIVSFSKKTGYLSIQADAGQGAIVFDGGFVVAAFTWETPPLDPRALALDPPRRDIILRARIEMALEHLIRLREGLFDFSLTDVPPLDVAGRDIESELLSQGINAQELLLDLARGMDEDRRNSSAAVEASFAEAESDEMDADMEALLTAPPLPARASAPPPLPDLLAHLDPVPVPVPVPSFPSRRRCPARGPPLRRRPPRPLSRRPPGPAIPPVLSP